MTAVETAESITILDPVEKGKFIVRKGFEVRKGVNVIPKGAMVTRNMIATLAAFGYAKVSVSQKPAVAIMGTGSEIVDIAKTPGRDQIRNSNSVMLKVLAEECGAATRVLPMVRDSVAGLKKAIASAVEKSDILVMTGGVSVGKYDFTKTALTELGGRDLF